jgi:hypothetical protein
LPAESEDIQVVEVDQLSASYDLFYKRIISEKTAWYCYKANMGGKLRLLGPSDGSEVWRTELMIDLQAQFELLPETDREALEFQRDFTRDLE